MSATIDPHLNVNNCIWSTTLYHQLFISWKVISGTSTRPKFQNLFFQINLKKSQLISEFTEILVKFENGNDIRSYT